ncbi:hypothetical protein G2W53_024279 [Senna tora]|uniref:Uncharacterized protein n=1 Tax=Senna tora TaxID=362788 RepID=A0A834WIZ1_9FABA|nr:hypothetical protein G2W53_024279 [Senna tora]
MTKRPMAALAYTSSFGLVFHESPPGEIVTLLDQDARGVGSLRSSVGRASAPATLFSCFSPVFLLRPLTYLESSLPKNITASATSSALRTTPFIFPPSKYTLSTSSFSIFIPFVIKGVATAYGDMQFTLIPCLPISTHKFFVRPTTACFDADGVFGYKESTVYVHLKNSLQVLRIKGKDGESIHVDISNGRIFVTNGEAQIVLDVGDDDVCTVMCEKPRGGLANATGAAGYESYLAF